MNKYAFLALASLLVTTIEVNAVHPIEVDVDMAMGQRPLVRRTLNIAPINTVIELGEALRAAYNLPKDLNININLRQSAQIVRGQNFPPMILPMCADLLDAMKEGGYPGLSIFIAAEDILPAADEKQQNEKKD